MVPGFKLDDVERVERQADVSPSEGGEILAQMHVVLENEATLVLPAINFIHAMRWLSRQARSALVMA